MASGCAWRMRCSTPKTIPLALSQFSAAIFVRLSMISFEFHVSVPSKSLYSSAARRSSSGTEVKSKLIFPGATIGAGWTGTCTAWGYIFMTGIINICIYTVKEAGARQRKVNLLYFRSELLLPQVFVST